MAEIELNALKQCPFCGRKAKTFCTPEREYRDGEKIIGVSPKVFNVYCICRQADVKAATAEKAAEKWNRRAPGWVSTKAAVPSDTRLCIIATTCGMGVARYFGEGSWIAAHDSVDDEVTHWHEMPKDWISASEKLPEEERQYLVIRDDKICCLADYDGDGKWMTWDLCNITRLVKKWAAVPDYPLWGLDEDETD